MTSADPTSPASPRGRPRSEAADRAIVEATVRLLREDGYARMSMEAVAAAAGVGKATLYRRYRDKADLATEAVAHLKDLQDLPASGDLRADLVENLRQLDQTASELSGLSMIGTLLVEERHNPELLALWRERVIAPRAAHMRRRVREGIEAGEIRPDLDVALALEMMVGAYFARHLGGEPLGEGWAERVVATIWPALVA